MRQHLSEDFSGKLASTRAVLRRVILLPQPKCLPDETAVSNLMIIESGMFLKTKKSRLARIFVNSKTKVFIFEEKSKVPFFFYA